MTLPQCASARLTNTATSLRIGRLIGPEIISLKGGSGGCYVKTIGKAGKAALSVNDIEIEFNIDM